MLQTSTEIEQFIENFNPPEGFTKEVTEYKQSWDGDRSIRQLILTNKKDEITIEIMFYANTSQYDIDRHGSFSYVGHTGFNTSKGWKTFDRTGVEDSFCGGEKVEEWEEPLDKEIENQLAKIKASRERAAKTISLPVPLSGWSRTPEEIEELKVRLRTKGAAQFYPSGFGTGYNISTKKTRFAKSAPALADFLEIPALYYETFDHD